MRFGELGDEIETDCVENLLGNWKRSGETLSASVRNFSALAFVARGDIFLDVSSHFGPEKPVAD